MKNTASLSTLVQFLTVSDLLAQPSGNVRWALQPRETIFFAAVVADFFNAWGFLSEAVRVEELLEHPSDEVFFAVQQHDFPCVFTEFVHERPVLFVLMDIAKGRSASNFKILYCHHRRHGGG